MNTRTYQGNWMIDLMAGIQFALDSAQVASIAGFSVTRTRIQFFSPAMFTNESVCMAFGFAEGVALIGRCAELKWYLLVKRGCLSKIAPQVECDSLIHELRARTIERTTVHRETAWFLNAGYVASISLSSDSETFYESNAGDRRKQLLETCNTNAFSRSPDEVQR